MLSVLIPVYNYDVRHLVNGLSVQCRRAGTAFEIICFDDASRASFRSVNREMMNWPGVIYQELSVNQGRARIRNLLAQAAKYEFLLFMDCDSGLVSETYIQTYLDHLTADALLYGGRVYSDTSPQAHTLQLHWRYGRRREQIPVERRRREPYHAFMTNNFVAPSSVLADLSFDERLSQYGHEDTIFGLELRRRGIPVVHLENPLVHLGLEPAPVFLKKTQRAVANLYFLYRETPLIETRLLHLFRRLENNGMRGPVRRILGILSPLMQRNLQSGYPSLFLFDLYKLWLLLREDVVN